MLGRKRKREALGREAYDTRPTRPMMQAMDSPKAMPEPPPLGTTLRWIPDVGTGAELGEHEALEQLHTARRTHERAKEAARDCTRLLKDSGEALDAAKARVRRFAER